MRRIALSIVLLLALLLVPAAAFAQDDACSGPLDLDSGFLADSREANMAVESSATQAGINISLLNAPSLPAELAFNMTIDGEFALDPDITARMMALQDADPADAAENIEELFNIVVEMYQTIAFNMDMDLGLSTDLANLIAVNSGLPSGFLPSSISLPTRMSEGFMYFNVDDIAASFDAPPGVEGWFGIDYGTLMADAVDQALAQIEAGAAPDDSIAAMGTSVGAGMALQESIKQYASARAVGVTEFDGVEVCEVHTTYDVAGFLSDPAFVSLLTEQMKTQIAMQEEMGVSDDEVPLTEGDIEMISQMLPMLAPMLLSGLIAESTQLIGVDDLLVRATETHIDWDMGSLLSMAAAMMEPGSAPADLGSAPVFSMSVVSEVSNFNEPFEVETPDPVQIIPLEALQEGME